MTTTVRSCLTAGVSVMTAAAIAFVALVSTPAPHPTASSESVRVVTQPIELTAAIQPLSTPVPTLLNDWLRRIVVPPSAGEPVPAPEFPPVAAATGVSQTIKNFYNTVEPWVRYGFELATYAVGWVPFVGWLSPQIMYFYNLGERIVRSITFNIADWLGGSIGFAQGVKNVGIDTINSFIYFANDQIRFWLPPLPPIPPLPGGSVFEQLTAGTLTAGPLARPANLVPSAGAEAPSLQNPQPIIPKVRDGRLATFVQRIADRATSAARTSVDVKTLGAFGQIQGSAGEQARPKTRDLVGKVRSTVRNLASSAPHPVRDRIAAAAAKAKAD